MHRIFPILTLLAACADTPEPQVAPTSPKVSVVDLAFCKGDGFVASVGQHVSTIQADLPARSRVLAPDGVASQDYRIDRLNVFVDGAGIIQRLTCG